MTKKSFKDFLVIKEANGEAPNDWRQESAAPPLQKGFIPPPNLRPVIRAFLNSDKIILMQDVSKHVTMPKKTLYLVGGPVRDLIAGKSVKDYDLATNATPEQIGTILSAAGFKYSGDKAGKSDGKELNIPKHFHSEEGVPASVEDAKEGDSKTWFIKGRDNSPEKKAFVIGATVNGDTFDIATFRKDKLVKDGEADVDFADNPRDDASRRDLTINSLYIELDKPDAENKKLYDPTKTGFHDLTQGVVKTVGKADERFEEDPVRIMRAIRFHCKFSKQDNLHDDISKAIPKFANLRERVASERIKEEFIKGLVDPSIDPKKYLNIYKKTGLLKTVFPDLVFDAPNQVPTEFSDQQDKALALAWLLQHNSIDAVKKALSLPGWNNQEKNAVVFLLKLKEFTPDKVREYLDHRAGTGLSNQQIRTWVEMFKIKGTNKHRRPWWAQHVNAFADHQHTATWDHVQQAGKDVCPTCKGNMSFNCATCGGTGKLPPNMRSKAIASLEADKFKDKIKTHG